MKELIIALALVITPLANAVPIAGDVAFRTEDITGLVVINGTGGILSGDTDGELTVDLAPFDTKDKLRNTHMHEKYLETTKYPKAVLKLDPVKPGPEFDWTGKLTLKNKTHAVTGKAKLNGTDVWAQFTLQLSHYPIGVPFWAKTTVTDDVQITINAKTK